MKEHSLSFGLDHRLKLDDQKFIINKYQKYLKNIYMCIPDPELNRIFSDRPLMFLNEYSQIYYDNIIDYCRTLGIGINFTINSYNKVTTDPEVPLIATKFQKYCRGDTIDNKVFNKLLETLNKYQPDEICTLDHYLLLFQAAYNKSVKYARSITNSNIDYFYKTHKEQLIYDILLSKNDLCYKPQYINYNIENRIMLNFGCPWRCKICGDFGGTKSLSHYDFAAGHVNLFNAELKGRFNNSLEAYFAERIWTGFDVVAFEKIFSDLNYSYKFANRTNTYNITKFDKALDVYTSDKIFILDPGLIAENSITLFDISNICGIDTYLINNKPDTFKYFDYRKCLELKYNYWNTIKERVESLNA